MNLKDISEEEFNELFQDVPPLKVSVVEGFEALLTDKAKEAYNNVVYAENSIVLDDDVDKLDSRYLQTVYSFRINEPFEEERERNKAKLKLATMFNKIADLDMISGVLCPVGEIEVSTEADKHVKRFIMFLWPILKAGHKDLTNDQLNEILRS